MTEAGPLTTTREVAQELNFDHFCGHLAVEANWRCENEKA